MKACVARVSFYTDASRAADLSVTGFASGHVNVTRRVANGLSL
jgi:hypothetical protein